ncbi:MAG: haloalkane dehalogenase [Gemmatimonadetes bacterium]|nr:haloalkane dehalogenase [Gemmatimonadota bacterium]
MPVQATATGAESPPPAGVLRTPAGRFAGVPDFPWAPRYTTVSGLRVAHVEEGPAAAPPVLMLHGEPTWSFLYRKMIPPLVAAGHRAIAPDLVGFGRSDKPQDREAYTYAAHVAWMSDWLVANDLREVTLVCQDWGSLIGLRLVAAMPGRFARVVVANGGLPDGLMRPSLALKAWIAFARHSPVFPIGKIVRGGCKDGLTPAEVAAYDAPFPADEYKAGARAFPALIPLAPDAPEAAENRAAWEVLRTFTRPFLCAYSDGDPLTRGADRKFRREIPGAADQPQVTIEGGGHFLQEDRGAELARVVTEFIERTRRP